MQDILSYEGHLATEVATEDVFRWFLCERPGLIQPIAFYYNPPRLSDGKGLVPTCMNSLEESVRHKADLSDRWFPKGVARWIQKCQRVSSQQS